MQQINAGWLDGKCALNAPSKDFRTRKRKGSEGGENSPCTDFPPSVSRGTLMEQVQKEIRHKINDGVILHFSLAFSLKHGRKMTLYGEWHAFNEI